MCCFHWRLQCRCGTVEDLPWDCHQLLPSEDFWVCGFCVDSLAQQFVDFLLLITCRNTFVSYYCCCSLLCIISVDQWSFQINNCLCLCLWLFWCYAAFHWSRELVITSGETAFHLRREFVITSGELKLGLCTSSSPLVIRWRRFMMCMVAVNRSFYLFAVF